MSSRRLGTNLDAFGVVFSRLMQSVWVLSQVSIQLRIKYPPFLFGSVVLPSCVKLGSGWSSATSLILAKCNKP